MLLVFLSRHQKDNTLFTAINQDIKVLSFQAGCRAFSFVSKLVYVEGTHQKLIRELRNSSEKRDLRQRSL